MTPLALGVLAVLLAGPVPRLLARVTMLRETPRTTMVLWQSIALAAVLAALGAGASLATDQAWRRDVGVLAYVVAALALIVTGLVLVRLLVSGHRTGTRLRALRRRHVELVDEAHGRAGRHGQPIEGGEHLGGGSACDGGLRVRPPSEK